MQPTPAEAQALLAYAANLLDQALALAATHDLPGAPPFGDHVGPHLRHVIEHFESWLGAATHSQINYDQRPRDPQLERSPALARQRLRNIQQRLGQWPASQLTTPLAVRSQIGMGGEFTSVAASSFGRELLFVASHAVHHFALLHAHCRQHDITIGSDFGKAPATVAHERARAAFIPHDTSKDTPCSMPIPAA